MEIEFYRGLAQRVRDIAERADPFTKRRLTKLAERYEAKGCPEVPVSTRVDRPLPIPRAPLHLVPRPGEA